MTAGPDSVPAGSEEQDTRSQGAPRNGGGGLAGGGLQDLAASWFRTAGIVIPFVILFITLSIASSPFLHRANLLNILDQQAATLIIAAAGTLVLVAGGIDLSVGAVYGLAGVIAAELTLHGWPIGVAFLIAVLAGFAAGLINGVVATFFRINALIATLAMSFVIGGVGSLITHGNLLNLFVQPNFSKLANTNTSFTLPLIGTFNVHTSTWIMVAAVILIGLFLARTTVGRYMYATGGNREAARIAGVRVNVVRLISFALSGGAAGLAGCIDSSRVLSASIDQNADSTLTFTVLAGIVVGGTSILGGEGAVWRTVFGVLFIAMVGNGYNLLHLDPLYEQITLGVLMILAVGIDAWARQRVG